MGLVIGVGIVAQFQRAATDVEAAASAVVQQQIGAVAPDDVPGEQPHTLALVFLAHGGAAAQVTAGFIVFNEITLDQKRITP